MNERKKYGILLVLIGIVLGGVTLAFPVEPVLVHDTRPTNNLNESLAEEFNIRVVEYENLSDRGQELYVKSLENGGLYRVPIGKEASDWSYPTVDEQRPPGRDAPANYTSNVDIIVERPENDSHLPPADEDPSLATNSPANESTVTRYDLMTTRTKKPPIGSGAHVPRVLGLVLGLSSLTAGGYLLVSKP